MRRRLAFAAACLALPWMPAAHAAPADPLRPLQWGLSQVHADAAWRVSRGSGVTVAVIDSGVDFTHPDLRGALLPGRDFTGSGTVSDDCGHGTEVAGGVAGGGDTGLGCA